MKKFFIEGNEYSMMRLLSFISVNAGILVTAFTIVLIFEKTDLAYIREMILLTGTLLGFGFGGKVLQKFSEKDQ